MYERWKVDGLHGTLPEIGERPLSAEAQQNDPADESRGVVGCRSRVEPLVASIRRHSGVATGRGDLVANEGDVLVMDDVAEVVACAEREAG
jgi:hypothetical protein